MCKIETLLHRRASGNPRTKQEASLFFCRVSGARRRKSASPSPPPPTARSFRTNLASNSTRTLRRRRRPRCARSRAPPGRRPPPPARGPAAAGSGRAPPNGRRRRTSEPPAPPGADGHVAPRSPRRKPVFSEGAGDALVPSLPLSVSSLRAREQLSKHSAQQLPDCRERDSALSARATRAAVRDQYLTFATALSPPLPFSLNVPKRVAQLTPLTKQEQGWASPRAARPA